MISNLIEYNLFGGKKLRENKFSQEDLAEAVRKIVESDSFIQFVKDFLEKNSLIVDEIEFDDEESLTFVITYESNRYDGSLPQSITVIMNSLAEELDLNYFGVTLNWFFGKNGNCNQVTLIPEEKPDPKFLRAKQLVKYI